LLGVEIFRNIALTVNKEVLYFFVFCLFCNRGKKMIEVVCALVRLILSYEEGQVIVS
jgi:hypothetical protein